MPIVAKERVIGARGAVWWDTVRELATERIHDEIHGRHMPTTRDTAKKTAAKKATKKATVKKTTTRRVAPPPGQE